MSKKVLVTFLSSNVRNFLTDDWLKIFNVIKDLMSRGYPELINSFTEEDAKILEASLNVLKKEMAENGKGGRHQTFLDLQRPQLEEENYNEGDSFVRYEPQCGNFSIFLSFRFYVKSILVLENRTNASYDLSWWFEI